MLKCSEGKASQEETEDLKVPSTSCLTPPSIRTLGDSPAPYLSHTRTPSDSKHGGINPFLPDSELETGDQENICLFQKYQLAAQLAVLTKELGG